MQAEFDDLSPHQKEELLLMTFGSKLQEFLDHVISKNIFHQALRRRLDFVKNDILICFT